MTQVVPLNHRLRSIGSVLACLCLLRRLCLYLFSYYYAAFGMFLGISDSGER